jgi:ribonuclease HII
MLQQCIDPDRLEAGCDEAGRGCLAGPVFAAAVILPKDFQCKELNDSKQLTERMRYRLRDHIEREAIDWAVGRVEADEIDRINILNASIFAMHRALLQLKTVPDFVVIDGNRFRTIAQLPLHLLADKEAQRKAFADYPVIPFRCEIKGDGRFQHIAAASILAKTYRDDCMLALHEQYPYYGWDTNKGYPTHTHREAIRAHGLTEHHRLSFRQLEDQPTLF